MSDYILITYEDLFKYGILTAIVVYLFVLLMQLFWLILLDKLVWPKFLKPLHNFLKKYILR